MAAAKKIEPLYISLSHLMPPAGSEVHAFVIPTGKEAHLECHTAAARAIYTGILEHLQGTPKSYTEIIKSLKLKTAADKTFAAQAFAALEREGMIADTTQLAAAFARTWQNPHVYTPVGYQKTADAERDRQPYAVQPGLESYSFAEAPHYQRQSTRSFDAAAVVPMAGIQSILADSYRTAVGKPRPLPSPGSIYPVRLHLINHKDNITDPTLAPGIYQYNPQHLRLERRTRDFPGSQIVEYLTNNPDAADPAAYIAISVDVQAFAQKYGNASLMFQGIVVGGVMQRLTDSADANGLGTLTLFGIRHTEADRILGHPANIKTVLLMAIGKRGNAGLSAQDNHAKVLKRLTKGAKKYILASGGVNFGRAQDTGLPSSFIGMWVRHPQLVSDGKTTAGHAFGTAATEAEALVKATAEALERVASANVRVDAALTPAAGLKHSWLDPRRIMPFDAQQLAIDGVEVFDEHLPLNWTQGKRLQDGERVFAPSALVYYPYLRTQPDKIVSLATSNGVAAHFDRQLAVENALLELIERDAIMRTWLTRQPPKRIDPATVPKSFSYRVKEMAAAGAQIDILNISTSTMPIYMTIIRSNRFPYFYAGAAARFDHEAALHKALDEAAAGYASRIMLERQLKAADADKQKQGIFDAESHGMLYSMDASARKAVSWLFEGELMSLPKQPAGLSLASLITAYNPVVFDLDNPAKGNELQIVRVICEDLIPIQFGKIGVPYLHHSLPAGTLKPDLPHFFN